MFDTRSRGGSAGGQLDAIGIGDRRLLTGEFEVVRDQVIVLADRPGLIFRLLDTKEAVPTFTGAAWRGTVEDTYDTGGFPPLVWLIEITE